MILLYIILGLLLLCGVLVLACVLQGKRAKKAEKEAALLHDALWDVQKKAGRLHKALGETAKAGEEADAKRKNLSKTPDAGLVGRANGLFNGQN